MLRKHWVIGGSVVLALALGAGAFYISRSSSNPFPHSIQAGASFPLYYPSELPTGWSIDKASFYAGTRVVGYLLRGPSGNLNVTVQAKPGGFDFNTFYTKTLTDTFQFLTTEGQGVIGKADDHLVGSLAASDSWILITPSSNNVSQDEIQFVINHLQKS